MKKVTITLLAVLFVATIVVAHAGYIVSTIEPITYGQPTLVDPTTVTPAAAPAAAPAATPAPAAAAPAAAAPAAAPLPPGFTVSDLIIDPARVTEGGIAEVTVTVKNGGTSEGTHTVVLMIDGVADDSETVTLAPGESTDVTLKHKTAAGLSPEERGQTEEGAAPPGGTVERDVLVEVDGLTGTFRLLPLQFMPIT